MMFVNSSITLQDLQVILSLVDHSYAVAVDYSALRHFLYSVPHRW